MALPAFSRGKRPRKSNKKKREKASRRKPKLARYLRKQQEESAPLREWAAQSDGPSGTFANKTPNSVTYQPQPFPVVADGMMFMEPPLAFQPEPVPGEVVDPSPPQHVYYRESIDGDTVQATAFGNTLFPPFVNEVRVDINAGGSCNIQLSAVTGTGTTLTINGTAITENLPSCDVNTIATEMSQVLNREFMYMIDNTTTGSAVTNRTHQLWNRWCDQARYTGTGGTGWRISTDNATTGSNVTDNWFIPTSITETANAAWTSNEWVDCRHTDVPMGYMRSGWPPRLRLNETEEQRLAREEREVREAAANEERNRIYRLREAEKRRKKEEAAERARQLLFSLLNPEQRVELEEKKHFHLTVMDPDGAQRVYRIDRGMAGNVKLLGPDGKPARSYCIHADSRLPYEDQMLAQMLLLEANEGQFLKIANQTVISHRDGDLADQLRAVRERHAEQEREEHRQAAAQ
jgi:hypothetical protein